MVRAAIRQLNDKDVRQRRRAVRKLFELDDPIAIDAFIPLLDDSDEWFRGKALMAIQTVSYTHLTLPTNREV